MSNLIREFYLIEQGKGRLLIRKDELLKRWVQGYAETLRPKQILSRFRASSWGWWKTADLTLANACWGGEVAANLMTRYLEPSQTMFYVKQFPPILMRQLGLQSDSQGEIVMLQRFWNFDKDNIIAPPLLVYADLVATAEARNLEVAQMIYDEHLARLVE